ncbi:MAG: AIR synthase-related protein, partial [Pseudomonadota bacterium]
GNVSLYNETDGTAILPTPTIGAVGLIEDVTQLIGGKVQDGDVALLLGETGSHLGQSALLAEAFGREDGDAPAVDLAAEKAHGDFIRANAALIDVCTDLADGGLALAAFEVAEAAGIGVTLNASDTGALFGEDQARYLIACTPEHAEALLLKWGVPLTKIGTFGGDHVQFGVAKAPLTQLSATYRSSFAEAVA